MGDFRRNVHLGRATQGTAITAARAVDMMRDSWQGVNILKADLANRGAGFGAAFSASFGADLSVAAKPVTAMMDRADPGGLVLSGMGAGWGAIPGGLVRGFWNEFMNNPIGVVATGGLWGLFSAGHEAVTASMKAADAAVTKLAGGTADNAWGTALRDWAKGGPILKRPSPKP
jgi:hypothetical protein